MLYTLKDLVDFCYKNKRHKGFREHTYERVAEQIVWAAKHNKLNLVEDQHGICGVIIATIYPARKIIYVHHIVAVRAGFKLLIKVAAMKYPDYEITGLRNSKLVTFNKRILWATIPRAHRKALERCCKH